MKTNTPKTKMTQNSNKPKINNQHEWDPLVEVVVGRWVRNTLYNPTVDQALADRNNPIQRNQTNMLFATA